MKKFWLCLSFLGMSLAQAQVYSSCPLSEANFQTPISQLEEWPHIFLNVPEALRKGQPLDFNVPENRYDSGPRCAEARLVGKSSLACQLCVDDKEIKPRAKQLNRDLQIEKVEIDTGLGECLGLDPKNVDPGLLIDREKVLSWIEKTRGSKAFYHNRFGKRFSDAIGWARIQSFTYFRKCLQTYQKEAATCLQDTVARLQRQWGTSFEFNQDDIFEGPLGAQDFGLFTQEIVRGICKPENYRYFGYRMKLKKHKGMELSIRCQSSEPVDEDPRLSDLALSYESPDFGVELIRSHRSCESN